MNVSPPLGRYPDPHCQDPSWKCWSTDHALPGLVIMSPLFASLICRLIPSISYPLSNLLTLCQHPAQCLGSNRYACLEALGCKLHKFNSNWLKPNSAQTGLSQKGNVLIHETNIQEYNWLSACLEPGALDHQKSFHLSALPVSVASFSVRCSSHGGSASPQQLRAHVLQLCSPGVRRYLFPDKFSKSPKARSQWVTFGHVFISEPVNGDLADGMDPLVGRPWVRPALKARVGTALLNHRTERGTVPWGKGK